MKKILFLALLTSYSLFADALPNSMKSTVVQVTNDIIKVADNIPAGVSGIVIHNYGNGLSAITHSAISLGNSQARIEPNTAIIHANIPSIKTAVSVSDKVIFGNFYDNALVIAPDARTYKQITKKFQRTWLHPDILALDFMQDGETTLNMDILKKFALNNQIGLILVVAKDQLLVIDPISKKVIGSTQIQTNVSTAMNPFFARFEQMDLSVFGFSEKTYTPYFQSVAGLK